MESFIDFAFNYLITAVSRYFELKRFHKVFEKTVGPIEKNQILYHTMLQDICDQWAEEDRRQSIQRDESAKKTREKEKKEEEEERRMRSDDNSDSFPDSITVHKSRRGRIHEIG